MELHNQLGKTAKPHPQNERTGTFPLDNFWTIPALMETQQGYEAPPPPLQKKKKQVGVGRPHPQAPPPPFRACACCGTVCAVIYEVDNTKTRSEPKV